MNPSACYELCPLGRRGVCAKLGDVRIRSLCFQIRDQNVCLDICFVSQWLKVNRTDCILSALTNGWTRNCFSMKNGTDLAATSCARCTEKVYEETESGNSSRRTVSPDQIDPDKGDGRSRQLDWGRGRSRRKADWSDICDTPLDLYQGGYLQWATAHGKNQQNELDYGTVSWVCACVQDDHHWISVFFCDNAGNHILEAMYYYIDVPCVVHWKYNETINLAIKGCCTPPFRRRNTPRSCFLRAQCLTITGMPEWVWAPERVIQEWDLGGTADLPPESADDGQKMNLMLSESHTTDNNAATIWAQCAKWVGDRRRLFRRSEGEAEEGEEEGQRSLSQEKSRPTKACPGRKAGIDIWCGNRERQPGAAKARKDNGSKKTNRSWGGTRSQTVSMKQGYGKFHGQKFSRSENGGRGGATNSGTSIRYKNGQRNEGCSSRLLRYLGLELWWNRSGSPLDQKKLRRRTTEAVFWKARRHGQTTARKTEAIAETAWQMSKSSNTKVRTWNRIGKVFCTWPEKTVVQETGKIWWSSGKKGNKLSKTKDVHQRRVSEAKIIRRVEPAWWSRQRKKASVWVGLLFLLLSWRLWVLKEIRPTRGWAQVGRTFAGSVVTNCCVHSSRVICGWRPLLISFHLVCHSFQCLWNAWDALGKVRPHLSFRSVAWKVAYTSMCVIWAHLPAAACCGQLLGARR